MSVPEPTFFGVPLARLTQPSLEQLLAGALNGQSQQFIATVNAEMLMAARKHKDVQRTLRRMHHRIPDGSGPAWLSLLTGQGRLQRFPGVDVLLDICRLSAIHRRRVLLLGGWGTTTDRAAQVLRGAFPGLDVHTMGDLEIRQDDGIWEQPHNLLPHIRDIAPDVIAVALGGAGYQRQERWIIEHGPQLPSVRLAIGVGGSLDMISGTTKRAPTWMRSLGTEWLWRLWLQPSRIKRIYTAVILFPIAAIFDRLATQEGAAS